MTSREIDWPTEIGPVCPLCGRHGCYREIPAYWRRAVELFPHHERLIPIARFQCRQKLLTFSMLPHQLAPYYQYTVLSMVAVLVLAEARSDFSLEAVTLELEPDCRVLPHLIRSWRPIVVVGMRRAVGVLCTAEVDEAWVTVAGLASLWTARGPPAAHSAIVAVTHRYSEHVGRWLLGTPSQERGRAMPW